MYKISIKKPKWMPGGYVNVINSMGINCVEFRFPRSARQVLRKRKPILPSVHAEKYRVVTESAIPGPWQNIVTPYLIDIMDAADYPSVLTLILCKCVQSGGSEAAHNFIG